MSVILKFRHAALGLFALLAFPVLAQIPAPVALPAENPAPVLPTVLVPLNGMQIPVEVDSADNPLVIISTTRGDMLLELFPNEAPRTVENFLGLAAGTKPFIDPFTGQEVTRPFYDGLTFHRVIDGFMIQGGSPSGQGDGTPGYSFGDEINALSLGLDKMKVLDEAGVPHPALGIRSQQDFQQRVLMPLYLSMGIDNQASLDSRVAEVERRLRAMTVKEHLEMLGYRYLESLQSRAPVRGVIAMANSGPATNGSQFFITLSDTEWLIGRHTVFGKVRAGLEVLDAIGKVRVDANARPVQDVTILSVSQVGR